MRPRFTRSLLHAVRLARTVNPLPPSDGGSPAIKRVPIGERCECSAVAERTDRQLENLSSSDAAAELTRQQVADAFATMTYAVALASTTFVSAVRDATATAEAHQKASAVTSAFTPAFRYQPSDTTTGSVSSPPHAEPVPQVPDSVRE